jgi:hypothetical protein
MKESTDTRKFENAPAGKYTFTVIGIPEKRKTSSGKSTFRIWKLKGINDEGIAFNNISILMFPWDSKDMLIGVGGTPSESNPEIVDWDDDSVSDKQITAELYYEKDKDGKDMAKLKNITTYIPF